MPVGTPLKILITGSTGQLGQALMRQAKESPESVIGLTRRELDITDTTRLEKVFADRQPAVVVNAAAYTDVDRAEQEPQRAFAANAQGPSYSVLDCAQILANFDIAPTPWRQDLKQTG
jgi:dTDP-4-dehydrorhamnose reductase